MDGVGGWAAWCRLIAPELDPIGGKSSPFPLGSDGCIPQLGTVFWHAHLRCLADAFLIQDTVWACVCMVTSGLSGRVPMTRVARRMHCLPRGIRGHLCRWLECWIDHPADGWSQQLWLILGVPLPILVGTRPLASPSSGWKSFSVGFTSLMAKLLQVYLFYNRPQSDWLDGIGMSSCYTADVS